MNKQTNNYARHLATGTYVFFDDAHAPSFSSPWQWAFFRRPPGVEEGDFRGSLVGHNLVEPESDPEAPSSAPS
jgi:hypothetical protein